MSSFYPLAFIVLLFQSNRLSAQSNIDLPVNIKLGDSKGKIIFYPGTESCFEDIEQYIHIIDSPELTRSYENYKSKGGVPTATVGAFLLLSLMSESAALGQIGQDDGRGKIYAISGVVALVGAFMTGSFSRMNRKKRIRKIVELYNQEVEKSRF